MFRLSQSIYLVNLCADLMLVAVVETKIGWEVMSKVMAIEQKIMS